MFVAAAPQSGKALHIQGHGALLQRVLPVQGMRRALGCKGDKRRGEMAAGTCPKDVEEDIEYRRASATEGCHVAPIHSLKAESYG